MKKIINTILGEPLLHFVLLAAVLFAAEQYWSAAQKEKIVVDRRTAEYLIEQREYLELRELTESERRKAIDAFVEDEILYREAYKRGLDQGDSRMRRNLILKMRGLLVGDLAEPSEAELRAFFEANAHRFVRPETILIEQVLFNDPAQIGDQLLIELRAGRSPAGLGDYRPGLERNPPAMSRQYLSASLGPEAAQAILAINDDLWHGPIESVHGSHFVRVIDRIPERRQSFDEVRRYLDGEWRLDKARQAVAAEIERLSDVYEIVIEEYEGPDA